MEYSLGVIEKKFAELIWQNEPVRSTQLVQMASEQLGWKKSTTFTVLRRLTEKGLFQNQNGVVTSMISKEAFEAKQSTGFVEEVFEGSLPAFLAAFSREKSLSKEEIEALHRWIDAFEEK